jgi:hypothetical protein
MKIKLLFLLLSTFSGFAQAPDIVWQKSFGGTASDYLLDAKITTDGGYIMVGNSRSNNGDVTNNHGDYDIWVVKTNAAGDLQWQKSYGGSAEDTVESVTETADGYIIAGGTQSNNGDVIGQHGGVDAWFLKINFLGEMQWQKTLGTTDNEKGFGIIPTTDGGYIAVAQTPITPGTFMYRYWIIKMDSQGGIAWEKKYGGLSHSGIPHDVIETDNGYLIIGESNAGDGDVLFHHGPNTTADVWVFKLSLSGEIEWQKSFGGALSERGRDVKRTNDGGYIFTTLYCASSDGDLTGNNGMDDIWIVKLDSLGNIDWQKNIGGSGIDFGLHLTQTADSGYLLAGFTTSNDLDVSGNHGSCDAWLVKLDHSGSILWKKTYGGTSCDYAYYAQPTGDGGFVMIGVNSSSDGDTTQTHGAEDFWLVKLGPETLRTSQFSTNDFIAYPNPANNSLYVHLPNQSMMSSFSINEISGKQIRNAQGIFSQIDISYLSKGIYFLTVIAAGKTYQTKFIKQ